MRSTIELSENWSFQPDPAGEGIHRGWFEPGFDAAGWLKVNIPSSFDMCLPILEAYEGHGWYRCSFSVPSDWQGKKITLHFAGANYHTSVWLNGKHLGDHQYGFLPFDFTLNDTLDLQGENVLAVCVDNIGSPDELPGTRPGWRPEGGLLREVNLEASDFLYLDYVCVNAEPAENKSGKLSVLAEVKNNTQGSGEAVVKIFLDKGDSGTEVASEKLNIEAGSDLSEIKLSAAVSDIELWSPENPKLYNLLIQICRADKVVDEKSLRIGFRKIETCENRPRLNGEPIYLKGFNRHEDSPQTGMCPDIEITKQDLLHMKAAGANFIRLCHYPHHPDELDLCDELGLLAMAENPLMWWVGCEDGEENCNSKLLNAKQQLTEMIRRDINHPSIIFWSVSNETQEHRPEVNKGNRELLDLARSLDPARLVTHASNRWRSDGTVDAEVCAMEKDTGRESVDVSAFFEADDIICVNGYPSLNRKGYGGEHDYDLKQSADFWEQHLSNLHEKYPGKPILISEFGYASLGGIIDGSFGEEAQAAAIEHEFAAFDKSWICGAAVWCWADHPWPQSGFCRNMRTSPYGVVTRDRKKLKAYEVVKKMFGDMRS
jgi:beta-galactosidase/beta-glucuronidase